MSAALWGLSLAGPQVGIAAADDSGQSSTSSDSSDSGSSADDSGAKGAPGAQNSVSSNDANDANAAKDADDADAAKDVKDADDADSGASDGDQSPAAVDVVADSVSEPAKFDQEKSDDQPTTVPSADAPTTPTVDAQTSDSALIATQTQFRSAALTAAEPVADEVIPAQSAAVMAVGDPPPPWAVQATSGQGPWQQVVNGPIVGFTSQLQSALVSLPLSSPFKDALIGTLWTVRRAFFNLAPEVTPVQIISQSSGPITGQVYAIDPEGDVVAYRLTAAPRYGSLTLDADGTYTYVPGGDFNGVDTFVITAVDAGLHVNLLDPFRGGANTGLLVNQDAVTFEFTFTEGGEYWTDDRRAALSDAARGLGAYILVNAPVTLQYDVASENDPEANRLASAGSGLVSSGSGFWRTVVQQKLMTGVDANGAAADGNITWNWGYSWNVDEVQPAGTYDVRSTAMHELLHSLGWLAYLSEPDANTRTNWPVYASLIGSADGSRAIQPNFTFDTAFNDNLIGGDGGIYFLGVYAVTAYGGNPVPLWAPVSYQPGSSLSHLDDDTFSGVDHLLMDSRARLGAGERTLSAVEIGVLKDIGYTVIPHPSTYMLTVIGFVFLRRGRREPRVADV